MGIRVYKYSALLVIVLAIFIYPEADINFIVEKIVASGCTEKSLREIRQKQYYHDFNFLGVCTFSITLKGKTDLPPGSWLILGLLYNDIRLNEANKLMIVRGDGTFTSHDNKLWIFKGDKKIFPGNYKVEVWFKADRQDSDMESKLSKFKTDIKKTLEFSIWDEEVTPRGIPLHLEISRLTKFYNHIIYHINYLAHTLYEEFNKYFPDDDKDIMKALKEAYKEARILFQQKQYDKIDYKKLCVKDLCFIPDRDRVDFDIKKWNDFAQNWKKTLLFFYNLARNAHEKCLINPYPEIAEKTKLMLEALLDYLKIFEKRLMGAPLQTDDPLNPNASQRGLSISKIYNDYMAALNTLKNKVLLSKENKKTINIIKIIRNIHSIYKTVTEYIKNLQKTLPKEKNVKGLVTKDNAFTKLQLKKLKAIEKDITTLIEYGKTKKNKTLLEFSATLKSLTEQIKIIFAGNPNLDYKKFLKKKLPFPNTFLDNLRMYRNSFLITLRSLLQSMGNQELYQSLNIEEEIKETLLPSTLTKDIEEKLDKIFESFRTDKQNSKLFTKSYENLKFYGHLTIKFILKKNLLDSKYRFERIYALHFLREPENNALSISDVEKTILKHIDDWFNNNDYVEELGYLYDILIENPHQKYLDILHKGIEHAEETIRRAAVIGLVKIASPKSFDYFLKALKDESRIVRAYAKDGLDSLLENPIEEDVKSLNLKKEEDRRKIDGLIEKLRKEWKENQK